MMSKVRPEKLCCGTLWGGRAGTWLADFGLTSQERIPRWSWYPYVNVYLLFNNFLIHWLNSATSGRWTGISKYETPTLFMKIEGRQKTETLEESLPWPHHPWTVVWIHSILNMGQKEEINIPDDIRASIGYCVFLHTSQPPDTNMSENRIYKFKYSWNGVTKSVH